MAKALDKCDDPKKVELHVNQHIGTELRHHRTEHGLTQQDLARELGVSFQQIQKYERGGRISSGKLYILAHAMQVPIAAMFPQDKVKDYEPTPPRILVQIFRKLSPVALLHTEEVTAIVKALCRISEKNKADE